MVGAQSIDTVCRPPVQGTIVEKCKGITVESVDSAYRIKYDIEWIGGVRSEIDPLERRMGPDD